MIKNYSQFTNEDLRSKKISIDLKYDNLKQLYPDIQVKHMGDLKIVISHISYRNGWLKLNDEFYEALEKDHINKDDIMFENCLGIRLHNVDGFTKVSDYGEFGDGIKVFSCYKCERLTSLEGAPKEVKNFDCYACSNLTSLQGIPKIVANDFDCRWCKNITSLEGAPEKVNIDFWCSRCPNLTSLIGAPKNVGRSFDCSFCNDLTSLQGAPQEVGEDFVCYECKNLTNLDGAPEIVKGGFYCRGCSSDFIKLAKAKYGDKVIA